MNELIKVDDNGRISAKEVYEFLELNPAHYARWCNVNIEANDFYQKDVDWIGFALKVNGNETRDYALTIDFAIIMLVYLLA